MKKINNFKKVLMYVILVEILILSILTCLSFRKLDNKIQKIDERVRYIEVLGDYYD